LYRVNDSSKNWKPVNVTYSAPHTNKQKKSLKQASAKKQHNKIAQRKKKKLENTIINNRAQALRIWQVPTEKET